MAVDNFFEDSRKRKRGGGAKGREAGAKKSLIKGKQPSSRNKGKGRARDDDEDGSDALTAARRRGGDRDAMRGSGRRGGREERDDEELGGSGSDDYEGASDDSDDIGGGGLQEDDFDSEAEEDAKETPAQKRLRLAKQYLDSLKSGQKDNAGFDAADLERDIIAERLQKDVLEVSGKLHLHVADTLTFPTLASCLHYSSTKAHRLPVTCAIATDDCRYLFTASKDGSIAKWDISAVLSPSSSSAEASTSSAQQSKVVKLDFQPKRRNKSTTKAYFGSKGKPSIARNHPSQDNETHGHSDEVYSLSLNSEGTRLASGGKDRRICLWDTSSTTPGQGCSFVSSLRGHKDSISAVSFRSGSQQVYTASFDRTVKIFDTASLAYIETLFGHQDKISDLSVLRNELAVTTGGRDKTLRYWKIRDESQLVFRAGGMSKVRRVLEGGLEEEDEEEKAERLKRQKEQGQDGSERKFVEGSVDCTAMVDDQHFLSGGDSGTISLWSTTKKKPVFSHALSHGIEETHSASEGIVHNPRWVVSLTSLAYSDLFASGSWDGQVRIWKTAPDIRSFSLVAEIPALGYVNSLRLSLLPDSKGNTKISAKSQKKNKAETGRQPCKGVLLVAGLGQEHKFGRWHKISEAKNHALVAVIEEKAALLNGSA